MTSAAVAASPRLQSQDPLRVLFVARAYPPTLGGMENFAYQLHGQFECLAETSSIINRRGKKALPAFLPYATAAAIRRVRRGDVDVVHLADALLAPVGATIKAATGVTVTASVCGLDVTYENPLYQAIVPRALRRLDAVMPISAATEASMRDRTGDSPASHVIPLGVNPLPPPGAAAAERFERAIDAQDRQLIVTVGRLVKRKGAAWFARNVVPFLPDDAIYVVVGEGKERESIVTAAAEAGVTQRVRLLGRIDNDMLAAVYARSDVFVMPNIPVPGDMEGFGLVALEAAASGLPVVASDLEGIAAAVRDGKNGFLIPPRDVEAFAARLRQLLALPPGDRRAVGARMARYTMETYGWERTASRYLDVMRTSVNSSVEAVRCGTEV